MRVSLTGLAALLMMATATQGLLPAAAAAAQVTLSCPAMAQAGAQFVTEVTIDVGTTPLGSYGITLTYDGTVLTVVSVDGGSSPQFSGAPTNNPNVCSGSSCETRVSGYQTGSLSGPTGVVSVAKVTFGVVATSSTAALIGLNVRSLYDTADNPITSATGTGCALMVTASTGTTTSTTLTGATTTTSTPVTSTTTVPVSTSSTTTNTRPPTTVIAVTTTTTSTPVTTTVTAKTKNTTLVTILPMSICPDESASATVQASVDSQCNCSTATNHGAYVRCAARVAKATVKGGALPKACQRAAKVCAARSTCGRPGFVTCCRTTARGATKCSIKQSAAACKPPKGGKACVGQRPSCCDACSGAGCASPTAVPY